MATTRRIFSPVRCGVVPLPGDANAIFLPLDPLISSGSVCAGSFEFTKIMFGCDAAMATAIPVVRDRKLKLRGAHIRYGHGLCLSSSTG